jgi:opacity protein-like surface antigen
MTTRFVLLGLLIASPAAAQQLQPPQQRWILGANVGGSSSGPALESSTDWKTGWSAGLNVAYQLQPKLALRADGNYATNDLSQTSGTPASTTFDKLSLMGNAVWDFKGRAAKLSPYVLGGLGAVKVKEKSLSQSFTQFGTNFGLGANYNLGRVGLRAEGRDMIYKFDHFGYNKTQNDVLWQGGVTVGL